MRILPNGVAVTGTTHQAQWCGTQGLVHDKWFAGFLTRLVCERNIRDVLQGGANIGTLTKPLLSAGCKVLACEPNADALACLRHNCAAENELIAFRFALADYCGAARLYVDEENAGASYCDANLIHDGQDADAYTIDHITNGGIDFAPQLILLDIEGWEPKALRGARRMFTRIKPLLALEVNRGALERAGESAEGLFALLAEIGYGWRIIQPDVLDPASPQYDILCEPL